MTVGSHLALFYIHQMNYVNTDDDCYDIMSQVLLLSTVIVVAAAPNTTTTTTTTTDSFCLICPPIHFPY